MREEALQQGDHLARGLEAVGRILRQEPSDESLQPGGHRRIE